MAWPYASGVLGLLVLYISLQLCLSSPINLALGKPAIMSSSNFASRAVDGKTDASRSNEIIDTGGGHPFAWWKVDLQTEVQDAAVKIFFRTDYTWRRNGLKVYTSTNPFSTYPEGQLCHTVTGDPNGRDIVSPYSVTCPGRWRYLLLYTDTDNDGGGPVLDFGEVQVMDSDPFIGADSSTGIDPCTNYSTLSHDNRVLTPLSTSPSAEECDHYLKPNWYRIDGNVASDLVNHCPDLGQCGTLFPVWLNGSTPSESDGIVDRIACKRGLSDAACCESPINIKLKNCGLFRVAYLEPLSGCPGKYCFEYNELCPPGQSSETGYMPCNKTFAHLSSSAKAEVEPFTNSSEATRPHDLRLFFNCNRKSDGSKSTYFFDVNWYINGKLVKTISKVPHDRYDNDTAFGEDASWRLPMMVNCSYRARSYRDGRLSPPVMSDEFFAGIMVSPEGIIEIDEGSTGTVYFQSTIPVPCITMVHGRPLNNWTQDSCQIHFENLVNETNEQCKFSGPTVANIKLHKDCGFGFNGKYWNSSQSMTIRAISDGTTGDPSSSALIRLATPSNVIYPLWGNYKLPEIKVKTRDRNRMTMSQICRAYADVEIDPFDGGFTITHHPGWYMFYNHTDQPIEVMIITETNTKWMSYGPTACAISIKAGGDIYMVYICNGKYVIKRLGCEHGRNLDVKEQYHGQNELVILPTGTKVYIWHDTQNGSHFLNIDINPSPDDIGKVTGLCGNLNGQRQELLTERYRLGDVINSDEFVRAVSNRHPTSHQICLCPKTNDSNPLFGDDVTCNWKTGLSCTRMNWTAKPCEKPATRDAHLDEEDWVPELGMKRKRVVRRVVRSTWTLPAARDKCLKVFEQYASFNKCRELSEVDVGSVLDGCAKDVVSIGTTDWIPTALELIKSQCMNILDVDLDLWKNSTKEAPSQGEVIFTAAKCPRECSNNGHCVEGVCKCNPEFVEEDCSVNLKIPPMVERLTRNGVCDLSNPNTSCGATHVFGTNFYDSKGLICRVKEIMIDENGLKGDPSSTEQPAVFENFRQILCMFPETKTFSIPHDGIGVRGYHVEVSNNGKIYSTSLTFVAADPRCHQCDFKHLKCTKKADSCLIEGKCYTSGEAKPSEPHMKCTPSKNGYKWTKEITVRLVDGISEFEGRVELLHEGKWGTLCDYAFDDIDAIVICKMLGHDDSPGKAKALKHFGGGSGPIWFDDPECKGTEADIADCPRMFKTIEPIWGIKTCHHKEDVGVRCDSRPPIIG